MTGKRAAIYTRISRDIEGKGLGVERQLEDCLKLAAKLGAEVVRTYSDNDISAYSGKRRPEYEQMLDAIQAGQIDVVLGWNTDRLHRRTTELERYIDTCQPRNVETHTVHAGRLDLSTANGRMVAKLLGAVAQQESELKAERIQRQKAQAAKAGKYLGGRVPWGWQMIDGTIAVDPVAAAHVRSGIDAIIAGRSLISVTKAWADAGAVSLSGKRMNTTQVRRVLLRPRNAGLLTFHGEVVSDTWPAIVPLAKFRQCEAILTSSDRPRQSEAKFKYLLSGIAKCYCGRYMTGFGAEGHRRSYRCKVHQEGGTYVAGHAIRAMQPLDAYVLAVAAEYISREDFKSAVLAEMQRIEDESRPVESSDIADLLSRKNSLVRLFAQGAISEIQLIEGSREIESKINELETMAASNGSGRAVASVMFTADPEESFKTAHSDVQREVLRALFEVDLKPSGPYRGTFDTSTVSILPKR